MVQSDEVSETPPRKQPGAEVAGGAMPRGQVHRVAPQARASIERLPTVGPMRYRRRHGGVLASFVIVVLLPIAVSAWYLFTQASDQYASTVGFTVRREDTSTAVELLGGITQLSGSSTSDSEVLYAYLTSEKLVADVDARLDLRQIWGRAAPEDFVFGFHETGTIEDLADHWALMVSTTHDSGTGMIEVVARAFTPEDAQAISREVFARGSELINELSSIAREDTIRYAREELDKASARLSEARVVLTAFRNKTQIVDPSIDLQLQSGIIGNLESQLTAALIESDLLAATAGENDPRRIQVAQRIRVIEARLADERRKLGLGANDLGESAYADLVGEFERLTVEREFAENAYVAALASYDVALAEARRQSRYLGAHVPPSLAQASEYPERWKLLGLIAGLALLVWSVLALVFYSLKDRR